MSRDWNGLDLQTEFSELLGDTTTSFKAKVMGWINEILIDIGSRHQWADLRFKGQKVLTAAAEEQDLNLLQPTAPTVAQSSGGTLTDTSVYKVSVTFLEGISGTESKGGVESAAITISGGSQQIDVTAIPLSLDPLVTARRIYLRKDSGEIFLQQTIADNTTTTATILANTTLLTESPDYSAIRLIDYSPFFETGPSRRLEHRPLSQMRRLFQGTFSSGSPSVWGDLSQGRIVLYQTPSSALTLSFYYYRLPARIVAESTSIPDLQPNLKPALRAGVLWKGFEYRDRAGQDVKASNYLNILSDSISTFGNSYEAADSVLDVMGDSDGFEV